MTPDDVRELAQETLGEWLPGYTVPEVGPQQRVKVEELGTARLVISMEDVELSEPAQYFEITLRVMEVPSCG